jgi:UrcA family protein
MTTFRLPNPAARRPLLGAFAFTLTLAAGPALAQPAGPETAPPGAAAGPSAADTGDYGAPPRDAGYSANEQVEVTAPPARPHFRWSRRLGAAPEKVRLSQAVPDADLDLTTEDGAYRLKQRVRLTARDVCDRLTYIVPRKQPGTPSCYKLALDSGLRHADQAIAHAREREEAQYVYAY